MTPWELIIIIAGTLSSMFLFGIFIRGVVLRAQYKRYKTMVEVETKKIADAGSTELAAKFYSASNLTYWQWVGMIARRIRDARDR